MSYALQAVLENKNRLAADRRLLPSNMELILGEKA